jgi:hypothetical protein
MRATVRTRVTIDATFSRRVQAAANQAARQTFDEAWAHILDTMGSEVWRWEAGRITYRGGTYRQDGSRTKGRPVGSPRNIVDTGLLRASGYMIVDGALATFKFPLGYATAVHYGADIYPWGDKTKPKVHLPARPFVTAPLGLDPYPGVPVFPLRQTFRENFQRAWKTIK